MEPIIEPDGISKDSYKTALPKIFEYVKLRDLMKMRPVNKLWNSIIVESMRMQKEGGLSFHVNSTSLDVFKTLSLSFPVKQFNFDGLNLEDIFGQAETFRRFSINHCLNMTSLCIFNCNLSTGRFFELLAFCKKLSNLKLRNVPSIYRVENRIAVYDWAFCFKSVRQNLSKVQSLVVSDKRLSHNDIWGLANKMTDLKHLHVHVQEASFIPIKGINPTAPEAKRPLLTILFKYN